MNGTEEKRALAFLHAAIEEDEDVLGLLMSDGGVTVDTFVELLRIASGSMEFFHGKQRALEIVQGWMLLSARGGD